ncbi:hypothetical protein SB48_HM08orf04517 [Heyndrickxia coagulans]|uniref:Uncharacterized protein n=1 Tax=Heyndrickxia coagulans TaxID=1398 RepID=A0AAN0WCE1_HEYCO|nr:hypothetical protein SB48_HM08orf04517 [Heyndrickxia coagulans]
MQGQGIPLLPLPSVFKFPPACCPVFALKLHGTIRNQIFSWNGF